VGISVDMSLLFLKNRLDKRNDVGIGTKTSLSAIANLTVLRLCEKHFSGRFIVAPRIVRCDAESVNFILIALVIAPCDGCRVKWLTTCECVK
jgi:hypothetical protein